MPSTARRSQTLVPLAIVVATLAAGTEAGAAIRNVSTTAQLRDAVGAAAAGDIIVLAPGVYSPSERLDVLADVTIRGSLFGPTVLDGGGENLLRIRAGNVRLENLTLRNGATALEVDSDGTTEIRGVTISGSTYGLYSDRGTVRVVNSTIAGNLTGVRMSCAALSLTHATISRNDRGLDLAFPCDDAFVVQNTLIVHNGEDCRARGSYTLDGATSFDSDGTCRAAVTGDAGAFATAAVALSSTLADNGGSTFTLALPPASAAVDAGSSCSEPLDQRGAIRDLACDAGAFERAVAITLPAATGAGMVTLTTNAGTFTDFLPVDEAFMPNQAGKPVGVTFPYGFFRWRIALPAAGGSADVSIAFPSAVPVPPQYWKVIGSIWTNVCEQLPCVANGNALTITFRDGGLGDLDGLANASLLDPGGLGSGGDALDGTAPQVHCGSPDGAWHADDVAIACTADDGESGLADAADASFVLSTQVAAGRETADATTGSRQVCDRAGNCVTAGPIGGNRVDKQAPAIAIAEPRSGDVYLLNAAVPAAYDCSDAGSGIASCAGPVASGANAPTGAVGRATFAVSATDAVGHANAASVGYTITFGICLLYDADKVKKSGSTYPIKLQLCDAAGRNVSSPSIVLHATGIARTSSSALGPVDDSGNANPDFNFRYDASLAGYIFNLKTTGLPTGTYTLMFTAGGDPVVHAAPFAVR